MKPAWAVLRISLFEKDFSLASASEEGRTRFDAALAFAGTALRGADAKDGKLGDALGRYEARVRHRSAPRSLFAAAALATPDGGPCSLEDVDVELASRRLRQPLTLLPIDAAAELTVSSDCVFHADGATLYRYDDKAQEFQAVRLELPARLAAALTRIRSATSADWERELAAEGMTRSGDEPLTARLRKLGVLVERGHPAVWNGPPSAHSSPLGNLQPEAESGRSAFATFRRPVAMPPALAAIQEVGELLATQSLSIPSAVPAVLSEWLDGRWLPLPELERMAEGLLAEAAWRSRSDLTDEAAAFVDWVRARAGEPEIDLGQAPPVSARAGHGRELVLTTEWTASGQLLEPQIFGASARQLLGRYHLPGLAERLAALEDRPPVLLAYHGARTMAEVAEIHAPGLRALEYCGYGSDPKKGLRVEQVEVTAVGRSLCFRLRDTQEVIRLIPAVPWNEELPKLHPLVRILLEDVRAEASLVQLFKRALQDVPVRPRLTYKGHIIRRRRAVVPPGLREEELLPWLARCNFRGGLSVEISDGRLPISPEVESPIRRELWRQLKAGKSVTISEYLDPAGVLVDGREHTAHALVPVRLGAKRAEVMTAQASVPPPVSRGELRGPFMTLRIQALAERMPAILRQLQRCELGDRLFYVCLSTRLDSELRLRLPRGAHSALAAAAELADGLLDRAAIRGYALEPYLREWDRYGGKADLGAIEELFVAESRALLPVCSELGVADPRRTDLYALCILQTLRLAGFEDGEARRFARERFDALAGEFQLESADRKLLGLAWRERQEGILRAAEGRGDPQLRDALRLREGHLTDWLKGADNPARLRRHLRSLLHMTGTRLHFKANRQEELRAFFFAFRVLDRWRYQRLARAAGSLHEAALPQPGQEQQGGQAAECGQDEEAGPAAALDEQPRGAAKEAAEQAACAGE